jgi:DNA-binding CsgD family transcriptional regulator
MPVNTSTLKALFATLTQTQQTIFYLVADGLSNQKIADRLSISLYQVKTQRALALERMGVRTPTAIAAQAYRLRADERKENAPPSAAGSSHVVSTSPLRPDDFFQLLELKEIPLLLAATDKLVKSMGFDNFFFGTRIDQSAGIFENKFAWFSTFPEGWVDRYESQNYDRIDPVVRHCRQHCYPLAWTNHLFTAEQQSADFYEEARAFGISAGGTCSLLNDSADFSGFSFTRNQDADVAVSDVQRALPQMHMLTSYLHEALRHAAPPASESLPRLTSQEHACLQRAFSGLNDSEIAERLKITSRTVRFHLGNVRQKLGAASRSQMVAKAILLGLVAA